jgi:alkylation response protein AidB-like acyl-CoA dehydrogenase
MRKLKVAILPTSLRTWLDATAQNIDTTSDNAAALLPKLAEAGLFRLGVPAVLGGHGGHVNDAIAGVAAVSEHSLAAGFVFWGQRTFIEYLLQSPNEALRDRLLPDVLAGRRAGATGLSNAMKFLAGIEGLQIKSTKTDGSLRVDGELPWVTNLRASGFDVAAAIQADGNNPAFVASLSSEDIGLERSGDLDLMAMRATSTAAVRINNVRIGVDRILHHNASEWLPKVRPAFLGLQCAMAIGLAHRSIAETTSRLKKGRDILREPSEALTNALVEAETQLQEGLCSKSFERSPEKLFELRIGFAAMAAKAVQIELSATGGRAYLTQPGEGFQRRLREVAFIPIITPSLVQLKSALDARQQPQLISEIA